MHYLVNLDGTIDFKHTTYLISLMYLLGHLERLPSAKRCHIRGMLMFSVCFTSLEQNDNTFAVFHHFVLIYVC